MEIEMQKAWDAFMQSGKINDYVAFVKLQGATMVQGEINTDANNNTGINPPGNQYR